MPWYEWWIRSSVFLLDMASSSAERARSADRVLAKPYPTTLQLKPSIRAAKYTKEVAILI